jgi:hypothetical protein
MSTRRRAAALGAVSLGLFALAACDKPTPLATVTVGNTSVHTEAASGCYNDGGKISQKQFVSCLQGKATQQITVPAGEEVRIGIDPAIADKGWILAVGPSAKSELLKSTYRSFNGEQFFTDAQTGQTTNSVTLNVIETTGKQDYLGTWQIKLVKGD